MEFKNYSFKDLLDNIVDNRGKTCPVESSGIPLIATNCIKDNSLYAEYERVRYISDETYKTWFRGHPEPEDIIFVCKGSPGRVAWAQNPVPYCIAQDMVAIRANKSVIDSKFLFALLRSPQAQKSILNMHVGTMIPHFKKGDFSNLYFDIPSDLEYQKWAGETYFSFSEKIELNKQTNQTLEQMAQALFKSWFVDFDPVFDNLLASVDFKLENLETSLPDELKQKAQRRLVALNSLENATECKASLIALAHELQAQLPIKEATQAAGQVSGEAAEISVKANVSANPNILTQHANTHAHFPNEFEHNEQLGWIPKGWEASKLKEFGKIITGKTPPKKIDDAFDLEGKGVPFITPSDVEGDVFTVNAIRHLTESGVGSVKNNIVDAESVCVTCIGSQMGKTTIAPEKSVTNQQLNSIVLGKKYFRNYIFLNLRMRREELFNLGSSGSTMPILNKTSFENLSVLKPNESSLKAFDDITESYLAKILLNSQNNTKLTTMRDTLLPKLISGKLQIPDVATHEEVID